MILLFLLIALVSASLSFCRYDCDLGKEPQILLEGNKGMRIIDNDSKITLTIKFNEIKIKDLPLHAAIIHQRNASQDLLPPISEYLEVNNRDVVSLLLFKNAKDAKTFREAWLANGMSDRRLTTTYRCKWRIRIHIGDETRNEASYYANCNLL